MNDSIAIYTFTFCLYLLIKSIEQPPLNWSSRIRFQNCAHTFRIKNTYTLLGGLALTLSKQSHSTIKRNMRAKQHKSQWIRNTCKAVIGFQTPSDGKYIRRLMYVRCRKLTYMASFMEIVQIHHAKHVTFCLDVQLPTYMFQTSVRRTNLFDLKNIQR